MSGSKVVDFETQFTDGSWVCTSNAESVGELSLPAEIAAVYLPNSTTVEKLLEVHADRVVRYLASRQGMQPVSIECQEDVVRSQCQQRAIKASFRQSSFLHRDEENWSTRWETPSESQKWAA